MSACSLRARRYLTSQGFAAVADDPPTAALARAARFQPQATLALLVAGVALVASGAASTVFGAAWFGVLAALGWLAVALPATNVFDRLAALVGLGPLGRPPAPRRFSQGIAATFLTAIAVLFALGALTAALVVSGVMAVAASLAGFADFCLGSEIFHLIFDRAAARA